MSVTSTLLEALPFVEPFDVFFEAEVTWLKKRDEVGTAISFAVLLFVIAVLLLFEFAVLLLFEYAGRLVAIGVDRSECKKEVVGCFLKYLSSSLSFIWDRECLGERIHSREKADLFEGAHFASLSE